MENILEKIYYIAGDSNKYQYRTLLLTFIFWIFANVLPSCLPFFEEMPKGNLYISNNPDYFEKNVLLNYTICENPQARFEVTKVPEYSIIYISGFYCNKFLVALLGISIFAGGSVGSMMLQFLSDHMGKLSSNILGITLLAVSVILVTFHVNYYFIFPLFFFIQLYTIVLAYSSIVNLAETTNCELRPFFISYVNFGFSISGLIFTLIFYLGGTWKTSLWLASSILIFVALIFYKLTVQSPRLWVSVGNYSMFYRSVRYISKVNNRWKMTKKVLPIFKEHKERYNTPSSEKTGDEDEEKKLLNVYNNIYEPLIKNEENSSRNHDLMDSDSDSDINEKDEINNGKILNGNSLNSLSNQVVSSDEIKTSSKGTFKSPTKEHNKEQILKHGSFTNAEKKKGHVGFNIDLNNIENDKLRKIQGKINESMVSIGASKLSLAEIQVFQKIDTFKTPRYRRKTETLIYKYFSEEDLKYDINEISDFTKLMTYPSQRVNFNVMNFSWFTITGIYYMSTIFLKYFPGSIFYNATKLYGVEMLSYIFSLILIKVFKLGRKDCITIFYCISILTILIISIQDMSINMVCNMLLLLRFGISGAHNMNFIISLEIYPTILRLTGFGINCNMGCFSAVFLPVFFEANIEKKLFVFFGFMLVLSAMLIVAYIPETNNKLLTNIVLEDNKKSNEVNSFFQKKRSINNNDDIDKYFVNEN